jgi:ABC-type transporter Mla subunit MlaD
VTAPANRWKLGLFVIGGVAAAVTGLVYVGMHELKREFHVAYAYFDEALTGLEEGSPVKFRGVTVGVVQKIRVAPDKKHLRVQAALFDDYLRDLGLDVSKVAGVDNLRAQVVMSWVTSTSFVQVDFFPDPATGPQQLPFAVPTDEVTLRTVPSTAKSLEDASRDVLRDLPQIAATGRELVELLRTELQAARLPELSRQLQSVLQHIDELLVDVQRREFVAEAQRAITAVKDAAASVRDDKSPIGTMLAELRGLADALRREVADARLGETTGSVRQATAAVGQLGADVRGELAQLRATLAAVERLAAMLERDPGALLHGRTAPRSPLQENPR